MIQRLPFHVSPEMAKENAVHREKASLWTTELIRKHYPTKEGFFAHYACSAEGQQLVEVFAKAPPGCRVLDIGAGYGIVAVFLASRGFRVSVVEPSPDLCEYMERAANLYRVKVDIYNVSAEEADQLPAGGFDVCLFHRSLHHCDDPIRALANCNHLLAADGKLFVLNEPLLQWFRSKKWFERRLEKGALVSGDYGGNEHIYYYHEYHAMLKQAGFDSITDLLAFRYRRPQSYFRVLEFQQAKKLSLWCRKQYYRSIALLSGMGLFGKPVLAVMKRLSLLQTSFIAQPSAQAETPQPPSKAA